MASAGAQSAAISSSAPAGPSPSATPPARIDGTPTIQERRTRTRSLTVNTNIIRPALPVVAVQHPQVGALPDSMMAPRPAPRPPQNVTPQQTLAVPVSNVEPLSPVTPPPGDAGAPSVAWVLHHHRKGTIQAAIMEQNAQQASASPPRPAPQPRGRTRTRTRTQTNPPAPVKPSDAMPPVAPSIAPKPAPVEPAEPTQSHLQAVAAAAARAHANAHAAPPRSSDDAAPPPPLSIVAPVHAPDYPEPSAWLQPELWVAPARFANAPPSASALRLQSMRDAMRKMPADQLREAFHAHEAHRRREEQVRITRKRLEALRLPITLPASMQKPGRGPGPLPPLPAAQPTPSQQLMPPPRPPSGVPARRPAAVPDAPARHPPAPAGPLGEADIQRAFAIAKRYLADADAGRAVAVDKSIATFLYAPPSSPDLAGLAAVPRDNLTTLPSVSQMLEPRVAAPSNMPPGTLVAPSTQLTVRPSPLDHPSRSLGGPSMVPSIASGPSPARARKPPPPGRVREREFERPDVTPPPRPSVPLVHGGQAVPATWVAGLPPPQPSPEVQRMVRQLGPIAVPGPFVLTGNEIWILDRNVIAELWASVGMIFEPGPAFHSNEVVRINLDFLYQCRLNQHLAQTQQHPPVARPPPRARRPAPVPAPFDATHPSAAVKRKAEHLIPDTPSTATPPVRRRVSYPTDPPAPASTAQRPRSSSACRPAPPSVIVHPPTMGGEDAPIQRQLVLGPPIEFRRRPASPSRTPTPSSAVRYEQPGPMRVAIVSDQHRTPGGDARSNASTPASISPATTASPLTPTIHTHTTSVTDPMRKASLSDQMDVDAMPAVA